MILSEIAGIPGTRQSTELLRLVSLIGPSWRYVIGSAGGPNGVQRLAIIYDENRVTAVRTWEIPVERRRSKMQMFLIETPWSASSEQKLGLKTAPIFSSSRYISRQAKTKI